ASVVGPGGLLFVVVGGFCRVRASARIGLLSAVTCGGAVGWSTRMRLPAFDASGPGHTTLASAYPIGPLARLAEASGTSPSWFPLVASSSKNRQPRAPDATRNEDSWASARAGGATSHRNAPPMAQTTPEASIATPRRRGGGAAGGSPSNGPARPAWPPRLAAGRRATTPPPADRRGRGSPR